MLVDIERDDNENINQIHPEGVARGVCKMCVRRKCVANVRVRAAVCYAA